MEKKVEKKYKMGIREAARFNATDQDEFEWALGRLAQMIKQANPHLLVDEVIKIKA